MVDDNPAGPRARPRRRRGLRRASAGPAGDRLGGGDRLDLDARHPRLPPQRVRRRQRRRGRGGQRPARAARGARRERAAAGPAADGRSRGRSSGVRPARASASCVDRTEQYHVVLVGTRHRARRPPSLRRLALLDTLLGGSSSSRLFQEIRERRGMAYSVYSFASQYQETGQVGIYARHARGEPRGVHARDPRRAGGRRRRRTCGPASSSARRRRSRVGSCSPRRARRKPHDPARTSAGHRHGARPRCGRRCDGSGRSRRTTSSPSHASCFDPGAAVGGGDRPAARSASGPRWRTSPPWRRRREDLRSSARRGRSAPRSCRRCSTAGHDVVDGRQHGPGRLRRRRRLHTAVDAVDSRTSTPAWPRAFPS